jgi:hypothetical protein
MMPRSVYSAEQASGIRRELRLVGAVVLCAVIAVAALGTAAHFIPGDATFDLWHYIVALPTGFRWWAAIGLALLLMGYWPLRRTPTP